MKKKNAIIDMRFCTDFKSSTFDSFQALLRSPSFARHLLINSCKDVHKPPFLFYKLVSGQKRAQHYTVCASQLALTFVKNAKNQYVHSLYM